MSNLDELLKLKELLDLEIITENDFKKKKAELFSNSNTGHNNSDSKKKEEIIIGENEKKCPSCKCIIEKESGICIFCNYDFINKNTSEKLEYPIKTNNNLKKYIFIFFLLLSFIFFGSWFFTVNDSNRSNELELKNHQTEAENQKYELQQIEIEEQKRILLEQKQKEAERISSDTTSTLSSEEVIRSRPAGYDAQAEGRIITDTIQSTEKLIEWKVN
jgi:hypothetical protein